MASPPIQSHCIRQTSLPGASALFTDLLYHPERVKGFYEYAAGDLHAARSLAATLAYPADRRAALVEALRPLNGDHPSLARLAEPGTVAVLTGQQVGLFSGPVYTLYKALTAIQAARQLTASGTPAVPVFWLATEDHDFAEINQAWAFNAQQEPVGFRADDAGVSGRPVGPLPLTGAPLEALQQALAGFPFGEEVFARVRKHYASGSWGSTFLELLKDYLAPHGLLFVDPLHPPLREIGAPLMAAAVAQAPALSAALLRRNRELADAKYHAQVHFEAETSLFFLLENGERVNLKYRAGEYTAKEHKLDAAAMAARAATLSPNALLRPVLQDYLFPTVAVVGGPAEIAYFAQSEVLYRQLLGHMPVSLSRAAFTLISPRVAKLLGRYGLTVENTWVNEDNLHERIAGQLVPPGVTASVTAAQSQLSTALAKVREALTAYDASLVAALANSERKMQYQLGKLERKVGREALRRDARAAQEAKLLRNQLYPHQHLQERFYGMLPFLATYGEELIPRLLEHVRLDCPDHQVLVL
ncbi:MAG: bacillithiol biosynthesis cysteine-adding enzyme BshC [Bryobacteraceae bacterium]|nr:bacillithiol biosynthesis cysteine-adding enzyme BshC [Bryobacteraceae bacterium]